LRRALCRDAVTRACSGPFATVGDLVAARCYFVALIRYSIALVCGVTTVGCCGITKPGRSSSFG